MYETGTGSQSMHRLLCGTYSRPVCLLNAEGGQALAPGEFGHTLRVTLPSVGIISGRVMGRPLLRSTPLVEVMCTKGSAASPSPLVRSSTYMYPLRSG